MHKPVPSSLPVPTWQQHFLNLHYSSGITLFATAVPQGIPLSARCNANLPCTSAQLQCPFAIALLSNGDPVLHLTRCKMKPSHLQDTLLLQIQINPLGHDVPLAILHLHDRVIVDLAISLLLLQFIPQLHRVVDPRDLSEQAQPTST